MNDPLKKRGVELFMTHLMTSLSRVSIKKGTSVNLGSYASIYNKAFQKGSLHVNAWIRTMVMRLPVGPRWHFCHHVVKMQRSQRLGECFEEEVMNLVLREERCAHIGRMMKLRKLQSYLVRYLWRPQGALAQRLAQTTALVIPY